MLILMNSYLEQELQRHYNLFKLRSAQQKRQFIKEHANSVRAVVGNAFSGADAKLIEALRRLEIVSSFSIRVDKIDLAKCREKGIRGTYTPDMLTKDVVDLAIKLMLAMLRRLSESKRYVRSGKWKKGDYKLTTKVSLLCFHFCSLFEFVNFCSLSKHSKSNTENTLPSDPNIPAIQYLERERERSTKDWNFLRKVREGK